jgi:hypothetical protein
MMDDPEADPDELAMKQALRRTVKRETASPELRARVLAALDAEGHIEAEQSKLQIGTSPNRSRSVVPYLAIAAVILIGMSVAYFMLFRISESPAPQWFADAMVLTHDQHAALPDHHLLPNVPANDLDAVAQSLSMQLGHPVLARSPGAGWTFAGGGMCNIRQSPAAHLLFRRGEETLSIFSVAASALYTSSDAPTEYAQSDQDHEIAGFVAGNAVHCIVCYSKSDQISLRQAMRIRDELRQSFVSANIH